MEASALHAPAKAGDLTRVQFLVESHPGLVHVEDVDGSTPLILAAHAGRVEVVRYLLAQGARVNDQNHSGATAIFRACDGGNVDVVCMLLERHADVTIAMQTITPLMHAAGHGHAQVVRLLLRHAGTGVNDVDSNHRTALCWSCYWGHTEVVRDLLDAGADPVLADQAGRMPLEIVQGEGYRSCTRLLKSWEQSYVVWKARRVTDAVSVIAAAAKNPSAQNIRQSSANKAEDIMTESVMQRVIAYRSLPLLVVMEAGGDGVLPSSSGTLHGGADAGDRCHEGVSGGGGQAEHMIPHRAQIRLLKHVIIDLERELFVELSEMLGTIHDAGADGDDDGEEEEDELMEEEEWGSDDDVMHEL